MSAALIISIHDVAPATLDRSRVWSAHLDERGVRATLLAVPGPWRGESLADDRATQDWLWVRQSGGDEIGLHGWSHRVDRPARTARATFGRCVARGAEEFWSLDSRQAARRVRRGLDVLDRAGLRPAGFTPPGWLINAQARHAVLACGIGYVADHRGAASTTSRLRAPALSHRPNGFGERAGAVAFGAIARRRAAAGLPVRLALHPADLDRPDLVATTLGTIDDALAAGARASTYGEELGLADRPIDEEAL
jgi:hypothetical protein